MIGCGVVFLFLLWDMLCYEMGCVGDIFYSGVGYGVLDVVVFVVCVVFLGVVWFFVFDC